MNIITILFTYCSRLWYSCIAYLREVNPPPTFKVLASKQDTYLSRFNQRRLRTVNRKVGLGDPRFAFA